MFEGSGSVECRAVEESPKAIERRAEKSRIYCEQKAVGFETVKVDIGKVDYLFYLRELNIAALCPAIPECFFNGSQFLRSERIEFIRRKAF